MADFKSTFNDLKSMTSDLEPERLKVMSTLVEVVSGLIEIDWNKASKSFSNLAGLKDSVAGSSASLMELSKALTSTGLGTIGKRPIEALKNLSEALNTFSKIDWKNALRGFSYIAEIQRMTPQIELGLTALGVAVLNIADRKLVQAFENLSSLSAGLNEFSQIKWTNLLIGFTVISKISGLASASKEGFRAIASALADLSKKAAQKAFAGLNELASGLKTFADISWLKIIFGLGVVNLFAKAFSGFSKAVDAMNGLASPQSQLTVETFSTLADSLEKFAKVSWTSVLIGLKILQYSIKPAFLALAAAGAVLMASIKFIGPAILALAAIGVALVPFGLAAMAAGAGVMMLGAGMLLMAVAVQKAVEPMTELASLGPDLFTAAAGITAVAAAMAAFSIGQTGSAIAGFFGKMLGGKSPIDQIREIADMGPNLEKAADALDRIKEALAGMPSKSGLELGRLNEESKGISRDRASAESEAAGGFINMKKA